MITISLYSQNENYNKPILLTTLHKYDVRVLYDTGADIPVWTRKPYDLIRLFGPIRSSGQKTVIAGFTGKPVVVPVYVIPKVKLHPNLSIYYLPVVCCENEHLSADLILSARIFRSARPTIDLDNGVLELNYDRNKIICKSTFHEKYLTVADVLSQPEIDYPKDLIDYSFNNNINLQVLVKKVIDRAPTDLRDTLTEVELLEQFWPKYKAYYKEDLIMNGEMRFVLCGMLKEGMSFSPIYCDVRTGDMIFSDDLNGNCIMSNLGFSDPMMADMNAMLKIIESNELDGIIMTYSYIVFLKDYVATLREYDDPYTIKTTLNFDLDVEYEGTIE